MPVAVSPATPRSNQPPSLPHHARGSSARPSRAAGRRPAAREGRGAAARAAAPERDWGFAQPAPASTDPDPNVAQASQVPPGEVKGPVHAVRRRDAWYERPAGLKGEPPA